MSYCRIGDDSDVTVICNTGGYTITTNWIKHVLVDGANTKDFVVDGPMKAATVLLMLRRRGLIVPQRAIDRLVKEARK